MEREESKSSSCGREATIYGRLYRSTIGRRLLLLVVSLLMFSNTLMLHTESLASLLVPPPAHESRAAASSTLDRIRHHNFTISNTTTHIALIFTTGGRSCDSSAVELLDRVWDKLVTSIHTALDYQPQWQIKVRFVQDGWTSTTTTQDNNETSSCIDWNHFQRRLLQRDHASASPRMEDRIHVTYHRTPSTSSQGIGHNMKESYAAIQQHPQSFDFITNLEDDVLCHRHWLLQLYTLYVQKRTAFHSNDNLPLLATAYNSNFTSDSIVSRCSGGGCVWKQKVYGPNYFLDNATFHAVVAPALLDDSTAAASSSGGSDGVTPLTATTTTHRNRPEWLESIDGWDSWVLAEYHGALRNRVLDQGLRIRSHQQPSSGRVKFKLRMPPGVLVLQPSLLQHFELEGSLHQGHHDVAVDFVASSSEDERTRKT